MKYSNLELYVSQPRLNRFLKVCGNSKIKAQKLYKINLRVAQSFYPLMNLFEIFLRNALYNQISAYFVDPNWILTQKNGFMSDVSLSSSQYFLRKSVLAAENNMLRKRIMVTSAKVVSEQTLGFWTAFFDSHSFRLVAGVPLKAFPNKPVNINRTHIWSMLKNIREFRNRIYHNEPICFSGTSIDFTKAEQVRDDVHLLISWIEPELLSYTEYFNNIDKKIAQASGM